MADLEDLKKAREQLIRERRSRITTILSGGAITDDALRAFITVQEAIAAIDSAIAQEGQ